MCKGSMAWGQSNWRRKSITVVGHGRESEGAIVAMKRGNSRGAKDPCRPNVSIRSKEIRLDERPTTEEHGGLNWDQPLAQPEVKSGILLPPKISELRTKLAHKAKQEPRFRFYALYDRIYRDDVLRTAFALVLEHNGAPGLDGVTCQDILKLDAPDWEAFFRGLHEEIRNRSSACTSRSRTDGSARWASRRSETGSFKLRCSWCLSRSLKQTSWTARTGSARERMRIKRSTQSATTCRPASRRYTMLI